MGQFRDRMDEELRIRGYSTSTRECYVRCVRNFVRHFMRPPDQLPPAIALKTSVTETDAVPQSRCYQRHRKGGPVTERARREYAEVLRRR